MDQISTFDVTELRIILGWNLGWFGMDLGCKKENMMYFQVRKQLRSQIDINWEDWCQSSGVISSILGTDIIGWSEATSVL